jgi:peptidyl-prolyl cis-trans isomerase C
LLLALAGTRSWGQDASKPAPSPVAPGDLSRPVFDTQTPVYGSAPGSDKAASTVVAEVEGRPITMGDVGDAIRTLPATVSALPFDTLYPNVLEQLIKQQALVVRAQQRGVDEEPAVRRRVRAAADRQLAEEFMNESLSKGITESVLLDRYNRDVAGRPGPEETRALVILVDTEKAATDLIAEIKGGADFAAVAHRSSKDATAPAGGDLGFRTRDQLNPQVGAVAFALPVGAITEFPVQTAAGWFAIKVQERRRGQTPTFAAVRETLKQDLLREGAVAFAEATLKDLRIRRYSFTGDETPADKAPAQ